MFFICQKEYWHRYIREDSMGQFCVCSGVIVDWKNEERDGCLPMNGYYSIGETASLLGVTMQTLRYYDKIGLLKPAHIDEEKGYWYYSFSQFPIIGRIKYLRNRGLSPEEIKVDISRLESNQGSADCFTFMNQENQEERACKIHPDRRYAIAIEHKPGEVPLSNMKRNLAEAKGSPPHRNLKYLRQYACLVDFDELVNHSDCLRTQTCRPLKYFVYLQEKPDFYTPNLLELPAGEYLCYRAKILSPEWDATVLATILKGFFADQSKPELVIVNEPDENPSESSEAVYEIQILL